MLLVPDAAGRASYHLNTFPSAAAAEAYIEFWFPLRLNEGIIAFWALTWEPKRPADSSDPPVAEPIVLIRDQRRPQTVYPFSFVSIDSALAFVREEVRWRSGLEQIAIYWAAPARVVTDSYGHRRLVPGEPPQRPTRAGLPPLAAEAAVAETLPPTPLPPAIRADNLRDAVEDALRSLLDADPADDVAGEDLAIATDEALRIIEERLDHDIADLRERRREALAAVEEALAVIRRDRERGVEKGPGRAEAESEQEAEEPTQGAAAPEGDSSQVKAELLEPALEETAQESVSPGETRTQNGTPGWEMAESPSGEQPPPLAPEKPLPPPQTRSRDAHQGKRRPQTTIDEVRKVLEVKRWEQRHEPFQGFNSPPGRF
jgi:hypothetical protein